MVNWATLLLLWRLLTGYRATIELTIASKLAWVVDGEALDEAVHNLQREANEQEVSGLAKDRSHFY